MSLLRSDSLLINSIMANTEIKMISIPAGSFLMGSLDNEIGLFTDEGPQHQVTLAGFQMGQTPITQAQWQAVMGSNPSRFEDQADSDQRPVECVSWYDAMEFCRLLSERTGCLYTLPSEAQWEYACRAGTVTRYAFGDTITTDQANYDCHLGQTTLVGKFPANAWGLHDMHGNVWEWCLDDWHDSYEGAPTDGSAWIEGNRSLGKLSEGVRGSAPPGTAARPTASTPSPPMPTSSLASEWSASDAAPKLLCGGSWCVGPGGCRSAYRLLGRPGFAGDDVGFRVVCLPHQINS